MVGYPGGGKRLAANSRWNLALLEGFQAIPARSGSGRRSLPPAGVCSPPDRCHPVGTGHCTGPLRPDVLALCYLVVGELLQRADQRRVVPLSTTLGRTGVEQFLRG